MEMSKEFAAKFLVDVIAVTSRQMVRDVVHRLGDALEETGSIMIRLTSAVLLHLKGDFARFYIEFKGHLYLSIWEFENKDVYHTNVFTGVNL